jgi:hypothetical protein
MAKTMTQDRSKTNALCQRENDRVNFDRFKHPQMKTAVAYHQTSHSIDSKYLAQ